MELSEIASELDDAHRTAQDAFARRDLAAILAGFSPGLRYRQADGQVIDRSRLVKDIRDQLSRLNSFDTAYARESIEACGQGAVEILRQTATATATAFLILHRTWGVTRRGRYAWTQVDGRWVIEDVEVLEEAIILQGFSISLRPPGRIKQLPSARS